MTAHALYVTAAYGISALAIAALIAWVAARPARTPARDGGAGSQRRAPPLRPQGRAVMAEAASPKPRRFIVLVPLLLFLGLAALFLMQLVSGRDVAEIPSALIGEPAPETNLPPLEGIGAARPRQPKLCRQGNAGECLGVVVRALPRGTPAAAGAVAGQALRHRRAELQGRAGECAALPRQPGQSLCGDRRRPGRPDGDRLGRLWRARDLPRRQETARSCSSMSGR